MKTLKIGLICLGLFSWTTIISAQVDTKVVEQVYADLVNAIGNRLEAPNLEIIDSEEAGSQAEYYPAYNIIAVSEDFLTFAHNYQSDEATILALVLGHELAHHYGKHALRSSFAANAYSQNRASLEAEADYFAIFFAYLAGYPTDKIESDFLKDFYQTFDIQTTESKHYPSLEKRLVIYENARKSIGELATIFQAGNQLLLVDEYQAAAKCFEFIATQFNSPEVLNNTGIAYLQAATTLFTEEELPFLLPTELEEATNLSLEALRDNQLDLEERKQKRTAYLDQAITNFRKALLFKTNYATARINLVNGLLLKYIDKENKGLIRLKIQQQIDLLVFQERQQPSISLKAKTDLLTGLFYFFNQNPEKMEIYFNKSCQKNKGELACWNLRKWQSDPLIDQSKLRQEGCIQGEAIHQKVLLLPKTRMELDKIFSTIPAIQINGYHDQLSIHFKDFSTHSSWRIEWMNQQVEEPLFKKIYFLTTKANYIEKNCRDIRLGTKKEVIEKKYGFPFQIKNTRQQQYHRYKNGSLLFGIKNEEVQQIITYYID